MASRLSLWLTTPTVGDFCIIFTVIAISVVFSSHRQLSLAIIFSDDATLYLLECKEVVHQPSIQTSGVPYLIGATALFPCPCFPVLLVCICICYH